MVESGFDLSGGKKGLSMAPETSNKGGLLSPFDPLTGLLLVLLVADFCVFGGWFIPVVSLSENQVLYIYSSQAQVVAAVYGLTITGYIFRSNQYDRLQDRDETLKEVLDKIKGRQHLTISFITVLSLSSIFLALAVIVFRESDSGFVRVFTQNLSGVLFVGVLVFVGIFVREAMIPDQIERASNDLKREVETSDGGERSSINVPDEVSSGESNVSEPEYLEVPTAVANDPFVSFMAEFNGIEKILDRYANAYLNKQEEVIVPSIGISKSKKYRRFLSTQAIVREMMMNEVLSRVLADRLLTIVRYRNALVHGSDFSVPASLLKEVGEIRKDLYESLNELLNNREYGLDGVQTI